MKSGTALRWMTAYAGTLTAAVVVFLLGGAAAPARKATFEEIDVQRINIREADGTLRLVVSGKGRFPGAIYKGREYPMERGAAGLLFFNDEGTENGGLIFNGARAADGKVSGFGHLSFDQYQQDQVLALTQGEEAGTRYAGLNVFDRPDASVEPLLAAQAELQRLPEAERRRRVSGLLGNQKSAGRLYVGKNGKRESVLILQDAGGNERLRLRVTASGESAIEFLDGEGKVVRTITAGEVATR